MNKITMNKMRGQIAVVILLFVLVALTIGLAVTQRSLTSITTSSQTEQASRAFSAAEAGLESAKSLVGVISPTQPVPVVQFGNQSQAAVQALSQLPKYANQALEYPPIGKDTIAQFWLADPNNINNVGQGYQGNQLNIYFGNNPTPPEPIRPAIEVNLIYQDTSNKYNSIRNFFDGTTNPSDPRIGQNGFQPSSICNTVPLNNTSLSVNPPTVLGSGDRTFLCRVTITKPASSNPIMLRIRVLYSDIKQPIAVEPVPSSCVAGQNCSLPQQAAIYTSIGRAGSSQKTIQVFREINFMPTFLDFAIFSSGKVEKLNN